MKKTKRIYELEICPKCKSDFIKQDEGTGQWSCTECYQKDDRPYGYEGHYFVKQKIIKVR